MCCPGGRACGTEGLTTRLFACSVLLKLLKLHLIHSFMEHKEILSHFEDLLPLYSGSEQAIPGNDSIK